jgi:3'5'-cyclic nucleotide phosphodiesterase
VIRTKHPLAIRYSDSQVLEHHHLASAFSVLLSNDENNIFENLPTETYRDARKLIIASVLSTDLSKHFTLLTELKTKLGNNFPTDSLEDKKLILGVTLRICDHFKVLRGPTIFFKWMDAMFEEFFKQGDMEKVLDLPISKFMDRENTNKEKVFSNYLNVVCRPLLTTYLILINDDDIYGALVREGIDKNKKNLEQRLDGDSGK